MIYRVEFRKDGSVASCVEVESQHKDGGLVCYVEAPNKSEAIRGAKAHFKQWLGSIKLNPGLNRIRIPNQALVVRGKAAEPTAARLAAVRPIQDEGLRAESERKFVEGQREPNGLERWVLRLVARAYDRDPEGFRNWLALMLGERKERHANNG